MLSREELKSKLKELDWPSKIIEDYLIFLDWIMHEDWSKKK